MLNQSGGADGAASSESGSDTGAPGSLADADCDWVCAKCLHKNFRTQKDCFRCFAPKQALAVAMPTKGKQFATPRRTVKI